MLRSLVLDFVVFANQIHEGLLAHVTGLALAVVGIVVLLVQMKFAKASLEGIVEFEEISGVLRLLAGSDVFEALRAAALVPNAARGNKEIKVKLALRPV